MTRPSSHRRGVSAVVILLVIAVIAIAGYIVYTSQGGRKAGSSAFEVARHAPQNTVMLWAWNVNGHLDIEGLAKDFRSLPPLEDGEAAFDMKQFEEEVGLPAEEFLALFDGRGFLAVMETATMEDPGTIVAIGLSDASKFATWWETRSAQYDSKPEEKEVKGVPFKVFSPDVWVGHDQQWLYLTNNEANAQSLVKAATGESASVYDTPSFQEGMKAINNRSAAGVFYLDTANIVNRFKGGGLPGTDVHTFKELAALRYAMASVDFAGAQADGFLAVEGEAGLAKKLLAPGSLNPKTAELFSADTTSFSSFDAKWTMDALVALATVSPATRSSVGIVPMVLAGYNPWGALTGEVSAANDISQAISSPVQTALAGQAAQEPEISAALVFPVKDFQATAALLNKAVPAQLKPKEDEVTTYPLKSPGFELTLNGNAPARVTLKSGPGAEKLLDTSSGSLADNPMLQKAQRWGGESAVYVDYLDLEPAYKALLVALEKEQAPQARYAIEMVKTIHSRVGTLEGSACLTVRPTGLHFRAFGSSNGAMLAGGGIMAAILIPNFVRAKGQGQLTACKSNQKNIGTAMEMYSTDYKGLYPTSMGKLTPNYLRTLPECPAAGKDTYSNSLKVTTQPDTFSFYCEGHHHAGSGVPADKPAYSSQEGLIER